MQPVGKTRDVCSKAGLVGNQIEWNSQWPTIDLCEAGDWAQ